MIFAEFADTTAATIATIAVIVTIVTVITRLVADTATATRRAIILVLHVHRRTTATARTFVTHLIVVIVTGHATTTRTRRLGVIGVIEIGGITRRLGRLKLRFLKQGGFGMLLDLQLQRRARGTYATHHAATSTTAARSRIGRHRTRTACRIIG